MNFVGNLILKQSKMVLENKQHAILCAVLFAVLPFASWLSVALVALVTLRKGAQVGFEVLLPALVIHSVPLMMMLPLDAVLINTAITYLPCYLAALTLRKTSSWQLVCGVFFIQAVCASVLIQLLNPGFIADQFNQFKSILSQYQEYQHFIEASSEGVRLFILAQLFFSIQILSVVVSSLVSLLFARSIQAKLFMPGAFKDELLAFRSGKIALLPLLVVSLAAYYEIASAINILPLVLGYFLISGFNLVFFITARKKQAKILTLLVLCIMLKPLFILGAYIALGSFDSIFNFRLYLPIRAREST